jgi:hypothetical protein
MMIACAGNKEIQTLVAGAKMLADATGGSSVDNSRRIHA